jgi:RNA polymerase sigma-70 factor (ECF subfamily)
LRSLLQIEVDPEVSRAASNLPCAILQRDHDSPWPGSARLDRSRHRQSPWRNSTERSGPPNRLDDRARGRHDLDLVARAARGDREAFDELVDVHLADLHRLALVVAGPDRAEDVTQDAFLAAWRELPRLRDPDRFLPWIRRILVNRARDGQRSERGPGRVVGLEIVADQAAADASPGVDVLTDLHAALATLTVDHRAVVGLHYLADLSMPEVAATLGIPVGTAKSRLNAALIVLRRRLGGRP